MQYTIHVGKTNSGKTYQAIQRLKEIGSGVYLAPLRLLAWEIYDSLNADNFRCNLITGEEQMEHTGAKITASTIEMLDYTKSYEVAIIDEAFMIGDRDRGKSWLKAILEVQANEVHIITNEEALDLICEILKLSEKEYKVNRYEMLQKFKFADDPFVLRKGAVQPRGIFVTFSRKGVLLYRGRLIEAGYDVSILYGNLPPEVKKQQIADFIEGKTQLLVTTDVIGMGLNVPCDYMVFLEVEKYDGVKNRKLNPIEIRQISGRVGRYNMSSENAFVTANSKDKLRYLKENYGTPNYITKAYCGLDYNFFCNFQEGATIKKRIHRFNEIFIIPRKLRHVVFKEDTQKYRDLAPVLDSVPLSLMEKWILLTSPVKFNNMHYFERCVTHYNEKSILPYPWKLSETIEDTAAIESKISELELYCYLSMRLTYYPKEKIEIIKYKEELIAKLTSVIADKQLASTKPCRMCSTLLKITHEYPYCTDCYEEKVKNRYYQHEDSWF